MSQLITGANQVGEILRARRKKLRLSQSELAKKLGVSQSRLSTLEADPRGMTLDRLLVLAKLLGLELVLKDNAATANRKSEW